MSSLLAKRISSCFFTSSYLHHLHHTQLLSPLLLRCSLSTQPPQQELQMPFIAHYLISSFAIPADQALKVSTFKALARIQTPEQPDSVVSFLKEIGFLDSQIRSLIVVDPNFLSSNVDNVLRPRARGLMEAGFTGEILLHLIQSNPQCLC